MTNAELIALLFQSTDLARSLSRLPGHDNWMNGEASEEAPRFAMRWLAATLAEAMLQTATGAARIAMYQLLQVARNPWAGAGDISLQLGVVRSFMFTDLSSMTRTWAALFAEMGTDFKPAADPHVLVSELAAFNSTVRAVLQAEGLRGPEAHLCQELRFILASTALSNLPVRQIDMLAPVGRRTLYSLPRISAPSPERAKPKGWLQKLMGL